MNFLIGSLLIVAIATCSLAQRPVFQVGVLLPISATDFDASAVSDIEAAVKAGVAHVNSVPTADRAIINVTFVDSKGDGQAALEAIATLYNSSVTAVVGPQFSAEVSAVAAFAASHDMIVVAPGSTAPSLGVERDNVLRLIGDDSKQGPVLAQAVFEQAHAVYIINRNDIWGEGIRDTFVGAFTNLSGSVVGTVEYDPDALDAEALVAQVVADIQNDPPIGNFAILLLSFLEWSTVMSEALKHESLRVSYFLAADSTGDAPADVLEFVAAPGNHTIKRTNYHLDTNDFAYIEAQRRIIAAGAASPPAAYAFYYYDSTLALSYSILLTRNTSGMALLPTVRQYCSEAYLSTGRLILNSVGDRLLSSYQLEQLQTDNQWAVKANV